MHFIHIYYLKPGYLFNWTQSPLNNQVSVVHFTTPIPFVYGHEAATFSVQFDSGSFYWFHARGTALWLIGSEWHVSICLK